MVHSYRTILWGLAVLASTFKFSKFDQHSRRLPRSRADALPQPAELLAQLLAGEFALQIPDLVEVRLGAQPLQPLSIARADVRRRPGCRLLLSRHVLGPRRARRFHRTDALEQALHLRP
jgi:hypothetical protein